MNLVRPLALLGIVAPAFAQYAGPAILLRGEAPAPMQGSAIDFRPFIEFSGSYDAGLSGVAVTSQGNPIDDKAFGVEVTGGVSGTHSWKHVKLGLDYRASVRHHPSFSFYDGSDQSLGLGLTDRLSRHATFTLRLAFGEAKGYVEAGREVPWATRLGGTFEHAEAHENKDPFELPAIWKERKGKLNPSTPFNFISTADIIGGNSGSPVVNREGELVGIIFDGNLQSLDVERLQAEQGEAAETRHQESEIGDVPPLARRDPHGGAHNHEEHEAEIRGIEDVLSVPPDHEFARDGDDGGDDGEQGEVGAQEQAE